MASDGPVEDVICQEILDAVYRNSPELLSNVVHRFKISPRYFQQVGKDGKSPLTHAAKKGHKEVLKEMMNHGADVNFISDPENDKPTVLMTALNSPACVELLLENKADVNVVNKENRTALHIGIIDRVPVKSIQLLLENGIDVDHRDMQGNSALIYASNKAEYIQLLLDRKAGVNYTNQLGQSALMLSIRLPGDRKAGTFVDVPKILLEAGADVHAQDEYRRSALHYACSYKNAHVAETLLQYGADINARDVSEQTPLMFSLFYGEENPDCRTCYDVLVSGAHGGADCDVNAVDVRHCSAMHHAARNGKATSLRDLYERGADVNLESKEGYTPIIYSIRDQKLNCVKTLLECGAGLENMQKNANAIHRYVLTYRTRGSGTEAMNNTYKMLLTAGLRLSEQLPCSLECQETNRFTVVPSLMHCCRRVIRKSIVKHNMQSNLNCTIKFVPLPQRMKDFLLYDVDLSINTNESVNESITQNIISLT